MINYYQQFIKPKEIVKDINYFYDKIKSIICNDLFVKYLNSKRKKINLDSFTIHNKLSESEVTRLRFNNDTIVVKFIKDRKSKVFIHKPIYKNYKIDGIVIQIEISITPQEEKSRMIYSENISFRELRKHINFINEYFVKKLRKSEESKYKIIYNRIRRLNKSYYSDWNRLINLITESVNPSFNKTLVQFKDVICGVNNGLPIVWNMIHETQFFKKYEHYRQIKFDRFIRSIRKECLDDNEIIELTNNLARCFGHTIKNYDECVQFLQNVITHFNTICHVKEMKINSFTERIWTKTKNFTNDKEEKENRDWIFNP